MSGLSRDDMMATLAQLFDKAEAAQRERGDAISGAAARISRCDLAVLILGARQVRSRSMGDDLFGEPSWDIILDLYVRFCRDQSTSISSACIASRSASTTALRHICNLEVRGYVMRKTDPDDRRRSYLELTDAGLESIEAYLDEYARWVTSLHRAKPSA